MSTAKNNISESSTLQASNNLRLPSAPPSCERILMACAAAIANDDLELARVILSGLARTASFHSVPAQRLIAHFCKALPARIEQSATPPPPFPSFNIIPFMQTVYNASPYYQFGYIAANSAIIQAVGGEDKVHIVDFDIGLGNQWISMIRAFTYRPGGPPQLRITGVAGPHLHANKQVFKLIENMLQNLAKVSGIQFEFNAIEIDAAEVEAVMIEKRPGEALVANMAFFLHRLADDSVCMANPRDHLLRIVHSLEPRVVTLVEYEADANTTPFLPRCIEMVNRYAAMFESLDAASTRVCERNIIKSHFMATSLYNIIACEGPDRVQRYEQFGKWQARMNIAGFGLTTLRGLISPITDSFMQKYRDKYFLKEEGGGLHLGWNDTVLVVASASRV